MDLSRWGGGRRKTLVILGAGASYGASFSEDSLGARPPLDAGFFSELQKASENDDVGKLLAFVREEFGSELGLSMEEFFSEAEYTDRFHDELNVDPGPKIKRYRRALTLFYESLPRLFREAIGMQTCRYHGALARALYTDDVIMSFNYDCLIDSALRDNAGGRWDPAKLGYGFEVSSGAPSWAAPRGRGAPAQSSITLLKPHGSLNWRIEGTRVRLERNPYSIDTSDGRIIPPTWFKRLTDEPFASTWKRARLEVRKCRAIVVVGYSVPVTDLFSRALFKSEAGSKIKREKLDFVILVNPDHEARKRFAALIRGGIEPTTRIIEYESFKDLATALDTTS